MDTQRLHEKASEAMINGNNQEAEELYIKILEIAPGDVIAHGQLMELYENTDREKYYLARANWNVAQGNLEHAINDCKKALGVNPTSNMAFLKLARLYKVCNKNLKAIDSYTRLLELDSNNIDIYFELADIYMLESSEESAINILNKALEVSNSRDSIKIKDALSKIYFKLSDFENALSVAQDENFKVKILINLNKLDLAEEILNKVNVSSLKKEDRATYYSLLAEMLYTKGELDKALEAVDFYVENSTPNAISYQMKALIYEDKGDEFKSLYNWGLCKKSQDKFEEAIVEFSNAHNINPKDKDTIVQLANLYAKTGDKYASVDFWKKDYELDKNDYAKNILADFYYEQGGYKLAQEYGKEINAKKTDKNTPIEEDEGILNKIMSFFGK